MSVPPETALPDTPIDWAGEAPPADADHTDESQCLNCGTPLIGPHCHLCGQTRHVHRTLAGFFHDMAHGVFHFEGRIWRTLALLVWHPGRLTRAYIEGRRATYVSPVAAFLFTTFLMFAVIETVGGEAHFQTDRPIDEVIAEHTAALAKVTRSGNDLPSGVATTALREDIAQEQAMLARLQRLRADGLRTVPGELDLQAAALQRHAGPLNALVGKVLANPALFIERIEANAHKYAWVLIPFSVPFVWLLFAFDRRWQLYDHSVFVTYSITFVMLLATTAMLAARFGLDWMPVAALVAVPLHMYRQLRAAYGLGRKGALWRTGALSLAAAALFSLFGVALVVLGAAD